ncbi:MAG: SigB/SigF/SigG family RNA polymerase sigma factor [Armatimonadetes bacterium]|nr:SigB/SigF/SigG family RNA polymerase sigma factor [Armatimonadota bacterium]MDW8122537.1 SigB/SigF/SigG family RNA polymerase sigma factor [Armatimonadota bacterium]
MDWQLSKKSTEELFRLWRQTGNPHIRDELIDRHLDLAKGLARRFVNRGEPLEDLIQVALFGLINAVDRFDPDRGTKFITFAVPTILGELKRHFRDTTWTLQVPRGLQELNQKAYRVLDLLTQKLGRPPTIAELAQELGVGPEQALEALDAAHAYEVLSLEQELETEDEDRPLSLGQIIAGDEAKELERMRMWQLIEDGLSVLDQRERSIVEMTYFQGLTQQEIAKKLGISQMHVSRLLRRALEKMRIRLRGTAHLGVDGP